MLQFLIRRSATLLLVLFGVSVITFGLMFVTPGDPAETIMRQQMGGQSPSEEAVEEFRQEHGLDDPLPIQYVNWLADVATGDLRESYFQETKVSTMILNRAIPTLELAVAGIVVAVAISIPAGIISAIHQGQPPDYLSQFGALLGISMPNFWLGYLLIIMFSVHLDIFPVAGVGGLDHLVLPALTLGTGMAAIITRLMRSSMLEVLDEEYIQTAHSKGLRERIVVYKHALRNALIPVITIIGLQFGYVLNGAVVIEIVFQRPGLGNLLIQSIFSRDYPVVQGVVLVIGAIFVFTNFAVDITYRFVDPRISFEGGNQ
ncbi:ABC transporter permease (plasmid) [Halorubrum salinarum]|uniref:ABC transporter permease n=1 Tax=Halorubrum salinarum TaxID=2739057 RepID=A0A7D3YG82_9EURY|nr:nickel ABC transporter permease [Halorubrum salinarum]QKG94368.1 ABC transporter permease [Halorubrum salinarum]